MLKIIAVCACVLLCSILLREHNRTFAAIISIAGGCLLFLLVSQQTGQIISKISSIAESVSSTAPFIKLMLKVLGITLITQFACDVCRDNGENALASMTEISAKILVVSIILPMFETVISIVNGLIK